MGRRRGVLDVLRLEMKAAASRVWINAAAVGVQ